MTTYEERLEEAYAEIEGLRSRLNEADETLNAIRNGAVDAIVVSGPAGDQVYTLTGADRAYRVLFETMNEGAAFLALDGTIIFCNAALSGMLKTPLRSLLGGSILDFVSPEDSRSFENLLRRSSKTSQKAELALKSADNNIMHTYISTSPFLIEDVDTICMIVTDITESKQDKGKLLESEEILRTLFDATRDALFVKDTDRRFIKANPACEAFLGHSPHELIGLKREELAGNEEEMMHLKDIDLRVLSGQSIEEQRILSVGGVKSIWKIIQMPLYDANGAIIGLSGIARDITDWQPKDELAPTFGYDAPYPSKAMRSTLGTARMAAEKGFTVLLLGESGSGKDYVAKYIHDNSKRADGPYFSINCAAITAGLAESELFGHEKGAFTGAVARKRGLLELAEGGTLLLNEIGDLPLPLQSKLLTFLDTKKFTRVGGEKEISVDVRLIAATNKDLEKEVRDGKFREDLFYRLNAICIKIPPLRERIDDIPVLVQQIFARLRSELQLHEVPVVARATMNSLQKYRWPGNVRELGNIIERSIILSQGNALDLTQIGFDTGETEVPHNEAGDRPSFEVSFPIRQSLEETMQDLKRFLVNEALRWSRDNRQEAAKLLGISRFTLRRHMKALGWENEK